MNHSILPLLIENHAHRFSCYNGWKISPESLDELIGISTKHFPSLYVTYDNGHYPKQIQESEAQGGNDTLRFYFYYFKR